MLHRSKGFCPYTFTLDRSFGPQTFVSLAAVNISSWRYQDYLILNMSKVKQVSFHLASSFLPKICPLSLVPVSMTGTTLHPLVQARISFSFAPSNLSLNPVEFVPEYLLSLATLTSSSFISHRCFLFFCLWSPDLSVLGSFLLQSLCYSLPPVLIFSSNPVFLREAFLTKSNLCNTDVYIAVYLPSKQWSPVKFYVGVAVCLIPAFLEPALNFIRARGVHSVHFCIPCIWHSLCFYLVCVHWTNKCMNMFDSGFDWEIE